MVPWTKTRSPCWSDSAMLSARVLNALTTWRVGSASIHSPAPVCRRWLTSTVISPICLPEGVNRTCGSSARLPSKVTLVRMMLPFCLRLLRRVRTAGDSVAPEGYGLCCSPTVFRRLLAKGDHGPSERPERRPSGTARARRIARKEASWSSAKGLFAGRAARRAEGCVEVAAAHDRKPGGKERTCSAAPTKSARQLLCRPCLGARIDDLLVTRRHDSASYSPYQHQRPHALPHHAPEPHGLTPLRTTNGTTTAKAPGRRLSTNAEEIRDLPRPGRAGS